MARLICKREVSAVELVTAHLTRIKETHEGLNAAVTVLEQSALEAAERADKRLAAGESLGPLGGIPFSVKDSIDVGGYRTTAGTVGRQSVCPAQYDATLVARLRSAGAIPIAKTNLPDLLFAYETDNLLFGRTNNPYDTSRTSGGSSGGESALIAACGSPLGLGSDAAGSVRVPAAFCGIASIKPTSGRLPRTGHVPGAGGWIEALWQIGPMARYVEDLQLAMGLLDGEDGQDYTSQPVPLNDNGGGGLRVAVFTDNGFIACSPAVQDVVLRAAEALRKKGMLVKEETPPGVEEAYELEMRLLGADGGDGVDAYLRQTGSNEQHWLLHAGFLNRMRDFRCSSVGEFAQLWACWDQYRARMAEFFYRFDAVLCPVYIEPALLHGQSAAPGKFEGFSYTMAWNVSGNPAAVVRCGECNKLPINVQVVTPRWQEARALQICAALEERFGGWQAPELTSIGQREMTQATARRFSALSESVAHSLYRREKG